MEFTSHVAGRNAKVAIYPDRIDWSRTGLKAWGSRKDTNFIPIRQIQGVTTHKAGLGYTTVRVAAAGDATEFRVTKREAEQVRSTLLQLTSQSAQSAGILDSRVVADELRKLAGLRDAGVLTEAEFAAQKARLLGSQPTEG